MTAIELRDKLNEFIALERGEEPVLFDSDAMCFDQHMIDIDDVSWEDPKELGDEFNGFWLHFNWEQTKCHHNTDDNQNSSYLNNDIPISFVYSIIKDLIKEDFNKNFNEKLCPYLRESFIAMKDKILSDIKTSITGLRDRETINYINLNIENIILDIFIKSLYNLLVKSFNFFIFELRLKLLKNLREEIEFSEWYKKIKESYPIKGPISL